MKESVNDDLEPLFEDLRLGEHKDGWFITFFLPKLMEEVLKMVESKDPNYMKTFLEKNADVEEAEMKLSESDSKFAEEYFQSETHQNWLIVIWFIPPIRTLIPSPLLY